MLDIGLRRVRYLTSGYNIRLAQVNFDSQNSRVTSRRCFTQVIITGLGQTTKKKKVCFCGKHQVKHSMADIQTGPLANRPIAGARTAYSTTPDQTCNGMTSNVAHVKDSYASK